MPNEHCTHARLQYEPSSWVERTGYHRATAIQRTAAATRHGQVRRVQAQAESTADPDTYPAPLVLPGDDLAYDPTYPKQSLVSWIREKDRNPVTAERRTVYIASAPRTTAQASFVGEWAVPCSTDHHKPKKPAPGMTSTIIEYLAAFLHGLPVRRLERQPLQFVPWGSSEEQSAEMDSDVVPAQLIGLQTKTECFGIRTRACPDRTFRQQLNVNDLIDVAISILPEDAYALVVLVDHDIYESDEDDFLCGRAYGGSRVAVVSSARYNPSLDAATNIDGYHSWPASHCQVYLEQMVQEATRDFSTARNRSYATTVPTGGTIDLTNDDSSSETLSPLRRAIDAFCSAMALLSARPPASVAQDIWASRVCRTASHELGHCFGMDHCVYYACNMQGCASGAEDYRQPPYLCPIDLAKLLQATDSNEKDRNEALRAFCSKRPHVPLFAAFAAWIDASSTPRRSLI